MLSKILVNSLLALLALAVAFFSFWRWRKSKRIWYIISAVAAILSGGAFWLARLNGYVLLAGAVLLFGLGELFKKK